MLWRKHKNTDVRLQPGGTTKVILGDRRAFCINHNGGTYPDNPKSCSPLVMTSIAIEHGHL